MWTPLSPLTSDLNPANWSAKDFTQGVHDWQDAGLFRARATVGVLYRGLELFTGYDYLNIGGVDLQGPLAGLRLWF